MGRSKLLLPLGQGRVIDMVLQAWVESAVSQVVVIVRQDDRELYEACQRWPVQVVQPSVDPPDMKASIEAGIREIADRHQPTSADRCLIAPADLPGITAAMIDRLILSASDSERIVVPSFGGRIGHPVVMPWSITPEIFELAEDQGVNQIVERHPTLTVPFAADQRLADLDTPDDYDRARRYLS